VGDIADQIVEAIANLASPLLYLAVFLLGVGESAIGLDLLVPGEVGMVVAGAAGNRAGLPPAALVLFGSTGAFLGDSVSYVIGRRFGRPLLCRWEWIARRMEPKIATSERYFAEHGSWTIVLARWVGALRAVVPFVAGVSRYPYRRFALWNAPSVVVWCTVMITIGYVFGEGIVRVIDRAGVAISITVIAALVGYWLWRRHRRRTRDDGEVTDPADAATRPRDPSPRADDRADSAGPL
jgi:membrane protein DedA with SNARE-associated domain